MDLVKRNLRYWSRTTLYNLMQTVLVSLVLVFFFVTGKSDFSGTEGILETSAALYPYYLILTGALVIMSVTTAFFQTYFFIFISLNSSRRGAVLGVMASTGGVILVIVTIGWVLWNLVPGEISESGRTLLPLITGALLAVGAAAISMGAVNARWGKKGVIVTVLLSMVLGGTLGLTIAMGADGIGGLLRKMMLSFAGIERYIVLLAGAVLYIAAGIFAMTITRKLEVRR
ncbi:MAG: hypothetical protein PHR92_13720 [Lachnospiraceae bacterium]|nr:hypothetical protein [Lachnospiraceae bacterium]